MRQVLKTFYKLLPYLSGMIILLGIIKATVYYRVFGIAILPYLEIQECLLLFLDDLLLIALLLGGGIFATFYLFDRNKRKAEAYTDIEEKTKAVERAEKIFNRARKGTFITSIVTVVIYVVVALIAYPLPIAIVWILLVGGFVTIMLTGPNIIHKVNNYLSRENNESKAVVYAIMVLSFMYLAILVFSALLAGFEIKYNISGRNTAHLTLKSNEQIKTSDSLIFVGKTHNYIFFYNPKTNIKTVLPMDEVKKLDFN